MKTHKNRSIKSIKITSIKYKHSNKMNWVPPRSANFNIFSQNHQNSLLMNGFVSSSGWAKFIVLCPFGSLRLRGYGTSGLKCASRNFVVECGASINTPLPLASFVFSNGPIGSVFVPPTFGLMTTPSTPRISNRLTRTFPYLSLSR
jgi:hypothetical protein